MLFRDHLRLDSFKSPFKNTVGLEVYAGQSYECLGESFKLIFHDLATTKKFGKIFNRFLQGANACVIVFDYTLPDILLQLEKWFFEAIINNGNIPLILIGLNYSKKIDATIISDIETFIEDKTDSWDLTVRHINIGKEKLSKSMLYEILISELSSRIHNPKLGLLQKGSLQNLKLLIVNDPDIHYIFHILSSLSRGMKISAKELIYTITSSFFVDLVHSQEQLTEIPKILGTFYTIDLPFAKQVLKKLKYKKLFALMEHETKLPIFEQLFYEYSQIDIKSSNKFLTKIPIEFFISKISQAWIKVTVTASWTLGLISELVSSIDSDHKKSSKVISYVSEINDVKDRKATFQNIGKLLAEILKIDTKIALKLIEDTPLQVQELALEKLIEIIEEKEGISDVMKTSIEAGEVSKKEAVKQEILYGLWEIDLITVCIKHSLHAEVLKLLDAISYEILSLKIEEEKELAVINQLFVQIKAFDKKPITTLLPLVFDSLVVKTKNEGSIIVIRKLLVLLQDVDAKKFKEFMNNFTLEFFVHKMLTHFNELDFDALDVPFLVNFTTFCGRDRYDQISQMVQNRFPDISYNSFEDLPEMLLQLVEFVKDKGDVGVPEVEKFIMKIYDLFIEVKIDELKSLIYFLLEPLKVTKAHVSAVFLDQFSDEDINEFSHEKKKLYDYLLKLPHEQDEPEDEEDDDDDYE